MPNDIQIQKDYFAKYGETFSSRGLVEVSNTRYVAVVEKMRKALEEGGPKVYDSDLFPDGMPKGALY